MSSRGSTTTSAPPTRFTGRAVLLVLVVLVLLVSYASSMRAYLRQRAEIADLHQRIHTAQGALQGLEREQRRWKDRAFVIQQARERFGFVLPGEVGYEVLGADGKPIESRSTLTDPSAAAAAVEPTWWQNGWKSMRAAGHPERVAVPAEQLTAPRKGRLPAGG